MLGVQPGDGPAAVTDTLQAATDTCLGDRPAEKLALRAALGLHPDAGRSLDERMAWLSQQLGMSSRSARRRIDTVDVELLFGGTLAALECPSVSHVRYTVRPPSPLHEGQHFSYDVLIRMPDDRRPRSHYVVQPMTRLEAFSVRAGFDPADRPARVWRVDGALPRLIDDPATAEVVIPDPAGQVQVGWDRLLVGRAYGIAWSWSEDEDTGAASGLESH